jgi:hypothetical protein
METDPTNPQPPAAPEAPETANEQTQSSDDSTEQPASPETDDQAPDQTTPETNADGDNSNSVEEEPAHWADIEEDTSTPDEEELKEIESIIAPSSASFSALDCKYLAFTANITEDTFLITTTSRRVLRENLL